MLGQLPLFLCKPLRYQVSKQFTFYHYLFVFYTSCSTADWALFRLSELQLQSGNNNVGVKSLDLQHKHKSVLLNYNRNPWLLLKLLGTRRSNRLSSRPDLWSSACFVLSWSQVFLLHTDPCLARQNPSSRKVDGSRPLRCFYTVMNAVSSKPEILPIMFKSWCSVPGSYCRFEKSFSSCVRNTFHNNRTIRKGTLILSGMTWEQRTPRSTNQRLNWVTVLTATDYCYIRFLSNWPSTFTYYSLLPLCDDCRYSRCSYCECAQTSHKEAQMCSCYVSYTVCR